ncbi:Polyadenylate-binding_protein [Hexamita inflata]|uniref:Polyadenylate-binding protein n=1 Tax=Hexamita inflata TaxID=28002 RepID=A0AA86NEP0_9EUKA|nr:Polyadenylate-binding protein [Hexamita inflata]
MNQKQVYKWLYAFQMSCVIEVCNLPPYFTKQQVDQLLQSFKDKIVYSQMFGVKKETGTRTAQFTFADEKTATEAIILANTLVFPNNKYPFILKANKVLQNQQVNKLANVVAVNLPNELQYDQAETLFGNFGKVLSMHYDQGKREAIIQYESESSAKRAIQSLHEKVIRGYTIKMSPYRYKEDKMNEQKEILMHSIPLYFDQIKLLNYICEKVFKNQQVDIIDKYDIVTFKVDNRPHPINSGGQQAIFTCKSVQIANQIAKYFEEQDGEMNNGVNEPVRVYIKYSAKIRAEHNKLEEQENTKKRGIQVYYVKPEPELQNKICLFFKSKFGEIEKLSFPKKSLNHDFDKYHINILFKREDSAQLAFKQGTIDAEDFQLVGFKLEIRLVQ